MNRKVILTFLLPFSPASGQTNLMWEVPALYPEGKKPSLFPKKKGHHEESQLTGLAKLPPVYYTVLILFDLSSYFYTTAHSSYDRFKSRFPYEGSRVTQSLHEIHVYAFLLISCLCPFSLQTQTGTLAARKKFLPCNNNPLELGSTQTEILPE